jgi:DNA-binding NtrC family response regulator
MTNIDDHSLDAAIRRHVLATLKIELGNKTRAARVLKIDRRTLYRMLDRWGYK